MSIADETSGEQATARFATADESFAINLVHHANEMTAITLRIGSHDYGDGEPEASPQTLRGLGQIATAIDSAIDPRVSPEELLAALRTDANNDRHLVQLGEGFDRWNIHGFMRDGRAYLVISDSDEQSPTPVLYAVDADDLSLVVERATVFYDASTKRPPRP